MATIINASNSTGLTLTSDLSGVLQFQNNGVNLPMSGIAPTFSAYQSSTQSVTGGSWTKVQFQTEEFDTANCFDNSTNYRFTPTVAGYYQINACVSSAVTGLSYCATSIYKNGTIYKQGSSYSATAGINPISVVSSLVYLNGSTDYIEIYVIQTSTGNLNSGISLVYVNGCLVRGA